MRRATLTVAALGASVAWAAPIANAQAGAGVELLPAPEVEGPAASSSDFWRAVRKPGWRRSQTLMRHGLERLGRAIQQVSRPQARHGNAIEQVLARAAMERFRLAHLRAPEDPEPLYMLARTRSIWRDSEAPSSLTSEDERTLELLEKLRRLDPHYQAAHVAFDLGILYTRAGDYRRAAAEYRRCLDRIVQPTRAPPQLQARMQLSWKLLFGDMSASTALYNLGDVTMMLGDLEGAVDHYERAIAEARRSHNPLEFSTQLLATWGAAAAHDRLGEHTLALERAREAIEADEEPMAVLQQDNVFFEPPFEIHYYMALGRMALASKADQDAPRREALSKAADAWERFVELGGDGSPWAETAKTRLQAVQERLRELGQAARSRGRDRDRGE